MATTTNMGLVLPDVAVTPGTQWATLLNAAQTVIDSHDHSSGKGVKITPSGMNISTDLSFASNNATTLRSVRFNNQSSFTPTASDIACFYVLNNEIYYRDGVGNSIQITSAGSLNTAGFSLSSLTLRDSVFTLQYFGDTSRQAQFSLALLSTATTRTYSLPDVTDTIVTNTSTSALTNKDIDGGSASNSNRITLPKNTKTALDGLTRKAGTVAYATDQAKVYVDNGSSLIAIGSGSAGLYPTIDFEDLTTGGISTFADGAVSIPVDGTGGSPNSTFVNSASSPLRGSYSGLFTKSGTANRQGEGFSLPITLASADTGKTIQVTFDWSASAAMPASSMVFYVYDITNAAIITPSQPILPTGTSSQYSVAFNATTSTSYRLIWMISTTTTTDFTCKIDQITYGTVVRPTVAGIGDWQNYTPTISAGFGTVTNNVAEYRRVGDSLQIQGSFTTGTVAASIASITIPTPFTIDTTKVSLNTTTASPSAQIGFYASSGLANSEGAVLAATTTSTSTLYFGGLGSGTTILTPANGSTISTSTSVFSYTATVPIAQWSSGITLASTTAPLQFSSNSSTSDANDTTSFTYGAAGSSLPGTLTALRTKRVQLPTPYSNIDDLDLFILPTTDQTPIKVGNGLIRNNAGTIIASPLTIQNTTTYGVGIQPVSGSKTQIDVVFGQYSHPSGATFASAGANWATANGTWFVKNRQSIGAAELAPATELSQGTVGYSQWASYTPTFSAAFGTTSGIVGKYRREGDSMRIKVNVAMGVAAASIATMTIPGSYTIDSTKLTRVSTTVQGSEPVGNYYRGASAANTTGLTLVAAATSASLIYFGGNWSAAVNHTTPGNGNDIGAGSENIVIDVLIPISGWN